jgi:hypothetical protein
MADGMLFVGWGEVISGREQQALQVFNESLQYYAGLQQQGTITSFEPVLLEPHGGDLAGFILLRGDRAKLSQLRTDPEFLRLVTRAQLIAHSIGVIGAYTGDELQTLMGTYQQLVGELA